MKRKLLAALLFLVSLDSVAFSAPDFKGDTATAGNQNVGKQASAIDSSVDSGLTLELSKNKQFYLNFDISRYNLRSETFYTPVSFGPYINGYFNQTETLGNGFSTDQQTYMPTIGLGVRLPQPFLADVLGSDQSLEFDYSMFRVRATRYNDYGGTLGAAWFINDNSQPVTTSNLRINGASVDLSDDYQNVGLYLQSNHAWDWHGVISSPSVGVVYTQFNQGYNYIINESDMSPVYPDSITSGWDSLKTSYYGVAVANKFEQAIGEKISWSADANLQLLYADANMLLGQVPDSQAGVLPPYIINANYRQVTGCHNEVTYRAQMKLAANYYFSGITNPNSIKASMSAGVDQWGYAPTVIHVHNIGDGSGMGSSTMTNYMLGMAISVPIA